MLDTVLASADVGYSRTNKQILQKKKISRQTPAMRSSLKPQVTLDGLEIHKYSLVLQVRLRQD